MLGHRAGLWHLKKKGDGVVETKRWSAAGIQKDGRLNIGAESKWQIKVRGAYQSLEIKSDRNIEGHCWTC